MPVSLMVAAAALSAAFAQPAQPAGYEAELLVANADGSWTITAPIHEEPVSLARLTGGLLEDDDSFDSPAWVSERDRMREQEEDDQVERAFEEAIDAVKRANLLPQD